MSIRDQIIDMESYDDYYAHLCKTDIAQNQNELYFLDLVGPANAGAYNYEVIINNGRIGMDTATSSELFGDNQHAAEIAFKRRFGTKCGLPWRERKVRYVPGKFMFVEMTRKEALLRNDRDSSMYRITHPEGRTDETVMALMTCIIRWDTRLRYLDSLQYADSIGKPVPFLSYRQVQIGFRVLNDVEVMVNQRNAAGIMTALSQQEMQVVNTYYSLIPHTFDTLTPPILDTEWKIEMEIDKLNDLMIHLTSSQDEKNRKKAEWDVSLNHRIYERLPVRLFPVSQNVAEKISRCVRLRGPNHSYVLTYVKAFEVKHRDDIEGDELPTTVLTPLDQEIDDDQEDEPGPSKRVRLAEIPEMPSTETPPSELDDSKLLVWHGTEPQNLLSILKRGLQMPTGHYMDRIYGNGVYFCNVPSEAVDYCKPAENERCFMFLCEIDISNPLVYYEVEPEAQRIMNEQGNGMVHGRGLLYPTETIEIEGTKIFSGGIVLLQRESGTNYDEYVIYDESKIKIRYIVEVAVEVNQELREAVHNFRGTMAELLPRLRDLGFNN